MVAVDEVNNRVITTSRSDLRTTIINATTNAIIGNTQSTQPDNRVIVDAAHHRAYIIGGITTIRSIDVTTGTLQAVLQVASDISAPAVNTQTHTAYVPQTTTGAGVSLINQSGLAGSVTLPHVDGREVVRGQEPGHQPNLRVEHAATAAGGSDGVPGFVHVIDGDTNAVMASVPAGAFPFGIGINEATNKIYVGNSFSGSVVRRRHHRDRRCHQRHRSSGHEPDFRPRRDARPDLGWARHGGRTRRPARCTSASPADRM